MKQHWLFACAMILVLNSIFTQDIDTIRYLPDSIIQSTVDISPFEYHDLQISSDYYAIGTYANTPYLQVEEMGWFANIENRGVAPSRNVELNLTVTRFDGLEVLNEDKLMGTIGTGATAENRLFASTLAFPQPYEAQGVYTLTHDHLDQETEIANNARTFTITDTLFAAETGRTRNVFIPEHPGIYARYISFQVEGVVDMLDAGGEGAVTTFLFESDGDVTGPDGVPDGLISPYCFLEFI